MTSDLNAHNIQKVRLKFYTYLNISTLEQENGHH